MDPNETVRQLRETSQGPARIRELGGALREWIQRGGFRPEGWSHEDAYRMGCEALYCRRAADVARFRDRYFGIAPAVRSEAR